MQIAFFEGKNVERFAPITLTHPGFELYFGRKTILEGLADCLRIDEYLLLVREYLAKVTARRHPGRAVNIQSIDEEVLFINSLAKPSQELLDLAKKEPFVASCGSEVLAAKLPADAARSLLAKGAPLELSEFKTAERSLERYETSGSLVLNYPWEIIRDNERAISSMEQTSAVGTNLAISSRHKIMGDKSKLLVHDTATIEDHVVLDARQGPIIIDKGVTITAFSRITGPTFIGEGSTIQNAQIRGGTTIGRHCKVGGEIDNSIIASYSNKSHEGFVGHSYVGEWVNLGALTTTSDLKNTYGKIRMRIGSKRVDTGLNKLGILMGDNARTSIGVLIYSALRVGVASHLHGCVTRDVPSFTIHSGNIGRGNVELELESAVETQKRMMSRRGIEQMREEAELLKAVFARTARARAEARVVKGKFTLGG